MRVAAYMYMYIGGGCTEPAGLVRGIVVYILVYVATDSMEYYRVYRVLCMGPGSAQSSIKRQASRCEIQSAALGVVLSGITINIDQYIILDHGYGSPV